MRGWLPDALLEVALLPLAKSGVDESTLDRNSTVACQTIVAMWTKGMRQEHAEDRRLLAEQRSRSRAGRK